MDQIYNEPQQRVLVALSGTLHEADSANIVGPLGSWFTRHSVKSVSCDVFSDARNVVDTLTARSNEDGNRTSVR